MISTTTYIKEWLTRKWRLVFSPNDILKAYGVTFSSLHGQVVLQHLVDNIYCSVCESNDPITLAAHNAQRAVVHAILQNIDLVQNSSKYAVKQIVDTIGVEINGS